MTLEAVTEALVALFTAALSVPVFDGPTPTEQEPAAYVIVGSDGDNGEDAVIDLAPSAIGNRWFDESGPIECAAFAWAGNGTLAAQRVIAQGLVDACRAALSANPTLGGVLTAGYSAYVSRVRRTQSQPAGPRAKFVFEVTYSNLLTPA